MYIPLHSSQAHLSSLFTHTFNFSSVLTDSNQVKCIILYQFCCFYIFILYFRDQVRFIYDVFSQSILVFFFSVKLWSRSNSLSRKCFSKEERLANVTRSLYEIGHSNGTYNSTILTHVNGKGNYHSPTLNREGKKIKTKMAPKQLVEI